MSADARPTLLIVDDQPENLAVLSTLLQPHYLVRAARSGQQALRAATNTPRPDLILLDVMMPEMDGYTVLAKLKEAPLTADIPVIFVTALDTEEDEERGFKLGAVEYITKPLKPAVVLARVRTQLERKQRERELAAARDEAVRAVKAKSDFLSMMSHEIRTPMNGILGMAQMLLIPNIKDEVRQDHARIILNSGQTLLALLNDILDVAKVESGRLVLESTALEPGQIIHETHRLFAETASKKGLNIESDWAGPDGQRYLGDPHRVRQMVSNLMSNAIKFTAQGHIRIEGHEVSRDGPHAVLEFTVSDTGIGIPEEKQLLLFKPFSQADSSTTRQFGGTGLGLSIVRNLAELMNGDAGVESQAGQGSRFWFRVRAGLDAAGADSRDDKRDATGAYCAPQTSAQLAGHILVADDNPTNRMVIKAMLDRPGLHCEIFENGRQAVDAISAGATPDLVLMDCQMPVMDGYEATRRIRRREAEMALRPLVIVALTASAFADDRQRCLAAGMNDFLPKPIDINKLMAILKLWLGGGTGRTPEADPAPQVVYSPQEEDLPVFDENILLTQIGGDRELAKAMILSAMDDIPDYFGQLEQAIATGNWTNAARQAHLLDGLAAQLGGMKLAARMKDIDGRLKRGEKADSATAADLRREYQTFSANLLEWIG